jgi:hypothetical protein
MLYVVYCVYLLCSKAVFFVFLLTVDFCVLLVIATKQKPTTAESPSLDFDAYDARDAPPKPKAVLEVSLGSSPQHIAQNDNNNATAVDTTKPTTDVVEPDNPFAPSRQLANTPPPSIAPSVDVAAKRDNDETTKTAAAPLDNATTTSTTKDNDNDDNNNVDDTNDVDKNDVVDNNDVVENSNDQQSLELDADPFAPSRQLANTPPPSLDANPFTPSRQLANTPPPTTTTTTTPAATTTTTTTPPFTEVDDPFATSCALDKPSSSLLDNAAVDNDNVDNVGVVVVAKPVTPVEQQPVTPIAKPQQPKQQPQQQSKPKQQQQQQQSKPKQQQPKQQPKSTPKPIQTSIVNTPVAKIASSVSTSSASQSFLDTPPVTHSNHRHCLFSEFCLFVF